MIIHTFSVGQLHANCYILVENDNCIIIDPGDEADFICDKILQLKLKPIAICATHGHFDHIMAVGEIQTNFNIPFYIHKKDLFLLNRVQETAEYYLGHKQAIIKPKNIKFFPALVFRISHFVFRILSSPGHTPGSVCFYVNKSHPELVSGSKAKCGLVSDKLSGDGETRGVTRRESPGVEEERSILISGDTLFKSGIGRYDFSYSSKKDLDNSLQKIFKLPLDTTVYPGHGEITTIGEEKNNIFLT